MHFFAVLDPCLSSQMLTLGAFSIENVLMAKINLINFAPLIQKMCYFLLGLN